MVEGVQQGPVLVGTTNGQSGPNYTRLASTGPCQDHGLALHHMDTNETS